MSATPKALTLSARLEDLLHDWIVANDAAAELRRQHGEIAELRAQVEALTGAIRDEMNEGLRLRELGGAGPDENITAFTERVICERDELRAQVEALAKPTKDQIQMAFEDWLERISPSGDVTDVQRQFEASSDYLDLFDSQPLTRPGVPSEHYDEVRATLTGLHALCKNISDMERRVGPLGSHARGYTHKITAALRHLDLLAAAPQPEAAQPESVTTAPCKGMNCGCTDGLSHSTECQAGHAAAIAGGRFIKNAAPRAVGDA